MIDIDSFIFERPLHPYTKSLLSSIPVITEKERELIPMEITLEGEIPSPSDAPKGCNFSTRCFERHNLCAEIEPPLIEMENSHYVKCHR